MKYNTDTNYKELIHSNKGKSIRNKYLMEHPICEYPGCGHLAVEVHHRIPLNNFRNNKDKMYDKAFDIDNLEALCHSHHNLRHIELGKNQNRPEHVKALTQERVNNFINNGLKDDE